MPSYQETRTTHCEYECGCLSPHGPVNFVVLTGGPGAGKTAVLESARKILCSHIALLPEAASILFKGGFWRRNTPSARKAAQKAIFHIQRQSEAIVSEDGFFSLGLCDRGTIDGLAYWPASEEEFWKSFHTTREQEFKRYAAVIHLRTPSAHEGYNYQNPVRFESPEEAALIDERIKDIWSQHPRYYEVESTLKFMDKVSHCLEHIREYIPACCLNHNGKASSPSKAKS